jgi:arylsulfatase A-like enzyme
MPTLCELLHLTPPKPVDGISILPTLLGRERQQKRRDYLYWEFPEYGGQQAVRKGNWKALRLNIMKGTLVTQLFDLSKDQQEQHDVAIEHPEIVQQMEVIMKNEHHTPEVKTFIMPALENK